MADARSARSAITSPRKMGTLAKTASTSPARLTNTLSVDAPAAAKAAAAAAPAAAAEAEEEEEEEEEEGEERSAAPADDMVGVLDVEFAG